VKTFFKKKSEFLLLEATIERAAHWSIGPRKNRLVSWRAGVYCAGAVLYMVGPGPGPGGARGWRRQQRGNMSPASGPLQLARRRCRLFGCPSLQCWGVKGLVCGGRTRSVPETSPPYALSVGSGAISPNLPCVPPASSRTLVFSGGGCGSPRGSPGGHPRKSETNPP